MVIRYIVNEILKISKINGTTFISICGWSDTGKSTMSNKISDALNKQNISCDCIITDSFMFDRDYRNRKGISGYNPNALKINELKNAIVTLSEGKEFMYFPYDNKSGKNVKKYRKVKPCQIIIIEGIRSFNKSIRKNISLSVFIRSDVKTLRKLRFNGNIYKRGFSKSEANLRINTKLKDYIESILPYRYLSDISILVNADYKYKTVD